MRADKTVIPKLAPLILKLWPDRTLQESEDIAREYICSEEKALFFLEMDGTCTGIAMCSLRHDYVEGCESSPIGYLEGIFVDETFRAHGIAKKLCSECEAWARSLGCREFSSDCELNNTASLKFHLAIGFTEENRIICFRKEL